MVFRHKRSPLYCDFAYSGLSHIPINSGPHFYCYFIVLLLNTCCSVLFKCLTTGVSF